MAMLVYWMISLKPPSTLIGHGSAITDQVIGHGSAMDVWGTH